MLRLLSLPRSQTRSNLHRYKRWQPSRLNLPGLFRDRRLMPPRCLPPGGSNFTAIYGPWSRCEPSLSLPRSPKMLASHAQRFRASSSGRSCWAPLPVCPMAATDARRPCTQPSRRASGGCGYRVQNGNRLSFQGRWYVCPGLLSRLQGREFDLYYDRRDVGVLYIFVEGSYVGEAYCPQLTGGRGSRVGSQSHAQTRRGAASSRP